MDMGLSFVMLGAADVNGAAAFYRDRLGLRELTRFENFVFLDAGGTTLVVTGELADGEAELVFGAESVEQAYKHFGSRGLAFVNEPRLVSADKWAVNFRDPAGHSLSFYGAQ